MLNWPAQLVKINKFNLIIESLLNPFATSGANYCQEYKN